MAGYFYSVFYGLWKCLLRKLTLRTKQYQLRTIEERGIIVDDPDNAKQFMRHVGLRSFMSIVSYMRNVLRRTLRLNRPREFVLKM